MMQNEFKADLRHENTLGGVTLHSEQNLSNFGTSRPVTQRSFVISEKTAALLTICVELDMLVEDLDLVVGDITNDDTYTEKVAMGITKVKDIILTRFLVPCIEMNLGSRDNLGGDTIQI